MPKRYANSKRPRKGAMGGSIPPSLNGITGWDRPSVSVQTADATGVGSKYIEHKFIRNSATITFGGIAGGFVPSGRSFRLDQVTNFTNLTNLFDQFRIDTVEISFMLRGLPSTVIAYPRVIVFPDFDDAATPVSSAVINNRPRLSKHTFTPDEPEFRIALKPRLAQAAFNGSFSAYSQPNTSVYVDCAYPATDHYGLKFAFENFDNTSTMIDYSVKFWLTMRNPN